MPENLIPDELDVQQAIQEQLSTEIDYVHGLLRLGVILPSTKDLHECGVPHDTVVTAVALYVKACLSYRAVIGLCEAGLDRSAMPVGRSLFETALNLAFLIRRRVSLYQFNDSIKTPTTPWPLLGYSLTPKFRTALYNAWCVLRDDKNIGAWKSTPGLKKKGGRLSKKLDAVKRPYLCAIGTAWEKRIKGANTCTGLSIENLAASLSPRLRKWYRTLYADESKSVHQSDMLNYLDVKESPVTFCPRWYTSPRDVSAALRRASTVYLFCVEEMNNRFHFGAQAKVQVKQYMDALRTWPLR